MSETTTPAEGEWRRTDPLGLVARLLLYLQRAVLPLIAVVVGARNWAEGPASVGAGLLGIVAINALFAWASWRHHRYLIGPDDIRVERGIISRSARSVPYERIQDVAIEEAPIPRLLGLVEVRFETGAGGKDEVKLAFVSRAQGQALRQTVRARQVGAKSDAIVEAPAEPPARVLFAMDLPRLLTFGLFEFSLVIFAVLFGLADQFDFLLGFDIWEPKEWQSRADLPVRLLEGLGLAGRVLAALLGVAAIALLGLATGIVRTALRDYGFLLEDTPRGLRRRRGLLTRTDVVMPLHRVQALKLATGILRRRFGPNGGWHGLEVVSLSHDAKSASHTVVPFATIEEIAPVAALTGFPLPGAETEWRLPSGRHRFDRALLVALPLGLVAVMAAAGGFALPALGVAALGALLAVRQLFLWRYDRHALSGAHLYVRRGWLAPRLDVASRVRLQSVEIVQGPLARRRGYADVVFGVAGGTLRIAGVALEEARAIRRAVLGSIAGVDFSRASGTLTSHFPVRPEPVEGPFFSSGAALEEKSGPSTGSGRAV